MDWSAGAVFSGLSNQSGEPVLPKGKVNVGCPSATCLNACVGGVKLRCGRLGKS